jgi:hypothetical protein
MYGIAYGPEGPCQSALDYYRKVEGKKVNYYTLGTDKKNLPYFGRGLIQLTSKSNYITFGDKIGVNLVDNADLALEKNNSYNIAIEYMIHRKTFYYVKSGDLLKARGSVGNKDDAPIINKVYNLWLSILKQLNPTTTNAIIVTIIDSKTNQPIQGVKTQVITPPNTP